MNPLLGFTGSERLTDRKYWNAAVEPRCGILPPTVCSLRNYCLAGWVEGTAGSILASGLPQDSSDGLSWFAALSIPERLKGKSLNLHRWQVVIVCLSGVYKCVACLCVGGELKSCSVQMGWKPASWQINTNIFFFFFSHKQIGLANQKYNCPERRALCSGYCSAGLENGL